MKSAQFACGEPLCKRQFEASISGARPWPITCPACGRSLYPDEVLHAPSLENLDQHRGPLMKVSAGRLSPATAGDLGVRPEPSILDEIADVTSRAHRPEPTAAAPTLARSTPRRASRAWVYVAVGLILVAGIVVAVAGLL